MEYLKFATKVLSFSLLVITGVGYAYLVYSGELPKPNIDAIVSQLAPTVSSSGSTLAVVAIGICFLLSAVAPFIYAARSGDFFTVIVSIVALVLCFTLLIYSRTVIDMVLAAIIYFTSALISVIMYSTNRISDAIRGTNPEDDRSAGVIVPTTRDVQWEGAAPSDAGRRMRRSE